MAALSRAVATVYDERAARGFSFVERSVGAGHSFRVDRGVVLVLREGAE
jgi:hypothetical protein